MCQRIHGPGEDISSSGSSSAGGYSSSLREQRIIPGITFTCDSYVTKWIVGESWTSNSSCPEMQVWRKSDSDTYNKVEATVLQCPSAAESDSVFETLVDPPIHVQNGDTFGMFIPSLSNTNLRIFEENGGPTGYYTIPQLDQVASKGVPFMISDSDVQQ